MAMASFLERNLTLRQLRLLSQLGRTLSLSKSAELLNTTQPALSRTLAQLEATLQVRLFERTTKRISPTAAGLSMVRHADRVLGELMLAEESLRDLRVGVSGELRLGVLPVFSAQRLAAALLQASQMLPHVRPMVQTLEIEDLHGALQDGRIDLMLAHAEWTVDLNRVEVTPLYEEFSSIVAAPRHRLALKRAPTWAEAANERWVLPPHRTPLRPKLDRMLSVHRRPGGPHPADIQADSAPLALHLVRSSGLLWATANHYAEDFERRGLVRRIAMPGELLRGPMCAFRLRSEAMNTPTRVFLQCMQDAAAAPLPTD